MFLVGDSFEVFVGKVNIHKLYILILDIYHNSRLAKDGCHGTLFGRNKGIRRHLLALKFRFGIVSDDFSLFGQQNPVSHV